MLQDIGIRLWFFLLIFYDGSKAGPVPDERVLTDILLGPGHGSKLDSPIRSDEKFMEDGKLENIAAPRSLLNGGPIPRGGYVPTVPPPLSASPIPVAEQKSAPDGTIDLDTYMKQVYSEYWVNADEEGDGDLIMSAESRNGLKGTDLRWPNRTIPFTVRNLKRESLRVLKDSINLFHSKTCIRFRPKLDSDHDYITINGDARSCLSYLGKSGGRQEVQLNNKSCFKTLGTSFHELMHVVGFDHEQNRHDRDEFVKIVKSNIPKGREFNFDKLEGISFGVPYDYGSVMHYSLFAFAKNRSSPTIVPIHPLKKGLKVGQRLGPSVKDLRKINRMYNCTEAVILPNEFDPSAGDLIRL